MQSAISLLSVVPIRKEPDHRSEMVSQLLFGEYVEVTDERKDFAEVKCCYDGYKGWIQKNQLVSNNEILSTTCYSSKWCDEVSFENKKIRIPMCTPVYSQVNNGVDYSDVKWIDSSQQSLTEECLQAIYSHFLNTPYLWGGKSVFGIDCSGFVQQVFKMFGVSLLRDAYLQATQGDPVAALSEAKTGDLAFFVSDTGRITHVGIILSGNRIVHASGRVRIDEMDEEGIVNTDTRDRTHQLHSIRRVIARKSF